MVNACKGITWFVPSQLRHLTLKRGLTKTSMTVP